MLNEDAYRRQQAERDTKRKKPPWQRFKGAITNTDRIIQSLLCLFTLGLIVVGFLQWQTLNSTEHVLDKTDQTLKAQQRPWLSVGYPRAVNPFPVGVDGGAFVVEFNLKNFGNTPALNIEIDGELPMMKSNLGMLARQDAICKRLKERPVGNTGNGLTIFPQENIPKRVSFSIQPGDVQDGIKNMGLPAALFMPIVIGCVRYVYSADMSQHETGFIFNVMHLPPNGILSADKGDIPPQEILLINPEMGASRAN